jgi:signal peptidase II
MERSVAENTKSKLFPFTLTAAILAADQASKALIAALIPLYPSSRGIEVLGDFFRIMHARNPGIAFSIGRDLPDSLRGALFSFLPLVMIVLVCVYYFRTKDLNRFQEWLLCGIVGGGLGNMIDRLFRPDGVIDFLDFKFYGLFGLERWPTFNVADSSVVVCGILFAASVFFQAKPKEGSA